MEVSDQRNFEKVLKKRKVLRGKKKYRMNFLGERYVRLIDAKGRVVRAPSSFTVRPTKRIKLKSYSQKENMYSE